MQIKLGFKNSTFLAQLWGQKDPHLFPQASERSRMEGRMSSFSFRISSSVPSVSIERGIVDFSKFLSSKLKFQRGDVYLEEREGGGMGELGDFARIDRARVVAISTGIRGIIAAPSSFRLCAELRIYKMERFHAVFNERSSRKATISNREAPYVASCIRRSMVYASIVPCFFRTIDLILLAANRSFRDEVKSGIDRCELSAN